MLFGHTTLGILAVFNILVRLCHHQQGHFSEHAKEMHIVFEPNSFHFFFLMNKLNTAL